MTEIVDQTITELECGHAGDAAVSNAALLLERAGGKKTGLSEFDEIEITAKQAERIKQALLFALQCHPPIATRGAIVSALARMGDETLKKLYVRELLSMQCAMRNTSVAMFQALLALESLGERVFPDDANSRSSIDVVLNWRCAEGYLSPGKK